jgi:hypothetical protein
MILCKAERQALPATGNKSLPCRPHPIRSNGAYSPGSGLNVTYTFLCPRLQGSPLVFSYV